MAALAVGMTVDVGAEPVRPEFRYTPPAGARPGFTVLEAPSPAALAQVLKSLLPSGLRPRYDRRVDTARRVTREYSGWLGLLYGEGLAFAELRGELHIRAGETLRSALVRWGAAAGVDVIFLTDRRYWLDTARVYDGSFADAARTLLFGLSHLPHPPAARNDTRESE